MKKFIIKMAIIVASVTLTASCANYNKFGVYQYNNPRTQKELYKHRKEFKNTSAWHNDNWLPGWHDKN